jgi:hypothetical protein
MRARSTSCVKACRDAGATATRRLRAYSSPGDFLPSLCTCAMVCAAFPGAGYRVCTVWCMSPRAMFGQLRQECCDAGATAVVDSGRSILPVRTIRAVADDGTFFPLPIQGACALNQRGGVCLNGHSVPSSMRAPFDRTAVKACRDRARLRQDPRAFNKDSLPCLCASRCGGRAMVGTFSQGVRTGGRMSTCARRGAVRTRHGCDCHVAWLRCAPVPVSSITRCGRAI